jgi:hypothetical protein
MTVVMVMVVKEVIRFSRLDLRSPDRAKCPDKIHAYQYFLDILETFLVVGYERSFGRPGGSSLSSPG